MTVCEFALQLGLATCLEFTPDLMVQEERVRTLCQNNKCGSYANNYMCPPYVGSLEEIGIKLSKFKSGLLLQYTKSMDVRNDKEGLDRTKIDFHYKILQIEAFLREKGIKEIWGMTGGSCRLCDICKAVTDEPCPLPDKARTSMEALGIGVLTLLDKLGLDKGFHKDRITWSGCILY